MCGGDFRIACPPAKRFGGFVKTAWGIEAAHARVPSASGCEIEE
jgi:hypothetical protein